MAVWRGEGTGNQPRPRRAGRRKDNVWLRSTGRRRRLRVRTDLFCAAAGRGDGWTWMATSQTEPGVEFHTGCRDLLVTAYSHAMVMEKDVAATLISPRSGWRTTVVLYEPCIFLWMSKYVFGIFAYQLSRNICYVDSVLG